MKKNISFIRAPIVLVVAVAVALVAGISAYFITNARASNSFTIGKVTSEIVEKYTPPTAIVPGVSFTKTVSVKNTGPVPCYVRTLVTFSNSDMEDVTTLDYDTTDWTYNSSDNYWYYNSVLNPGETTKPLFTTVKISDDADESKLTDYQISVYHESSSKQW